MRYTVLIVEDQQEISSIVAKYLENEGYETLCAANGLEALELFGSNRIHLTLLDIMMPGIDGFDVLREIRKTSEVPVIFLTARAEEIDRLKGFDIGADDYVTKPFSMRELMARVKANLRRVEFSNGESTNGDIIVSGDLSIDLNKYEVKKDGKVVELTLREFELLKFLVSSAGQVFSREQLLEEVWGYEYYGDIRTVDVTVRRLREKIEDEDGEYKYILTKRGVGYYFGRG